jgi:hypothetical protein
MARMRQKSTEHPTQKAILELCQRPGLKLWRNNRGVLTGKNEKTGKSYFVKYGLGDGASDILGYKKDAVANEWVARFVAIEVKDEKWKPPNPPKPGCAKSTRQKYERYLQQRDFIEAVKAAGGFAGFARTVQDAMRILGMR